MIYKKKILKIFLIVVMSLTTISSFSQSVFDCYSSEGCITKGDESFANADYYSASVYFHNAWIMDSSIFEIAYKYAEASRLFYNYVEAENWYKYVINNDTAGKFPLSNFWLPVMNKNNGKYHEAILNFQKYYEVHKNQKDYYTKKAFNEISSCEYALELINDTLSVSIDHLEKSINTAYTEFGAIQMGEDKLYFSSLRPLLSFEVESFMPKAFLSKIYESKLTVAGWTRAKELDKIINNKNTHNANIIFTPDHEKFYFSRCSADELSQLQCEIFVCEKKDGNWQKPQKLENNINVEGYTSTQPAYYSGDVYSVLYFVSDRPNGYGKMDVWYSLIKDGKYIEPVNLGSIINSPGNEISPFYYDKKNTLYFSSDWHKGLGGYDIFKSAGGLNDWKPPQNIGFPLNSSCNDFYFTINEVDTDGYFTSNRYGSYYIKGETCCNDIYYYEWEKPKPIEFAEEEKDTVKIEEKIKLLLPLTLYFHNDIPDPKSTKIVTEQNYKTTLAEYFTLKDTYKKEYSKGLKGTEKQKALNDIENFFDNYIGKGFSDLEKFAQLLLRDLESGSDVKIKIKGYCSPLNTTEYNLNLAKRRILSLKNYLIEYDDGIFVKYFDANSDDGGKLTIYEDPIGEAQAKQFVSDNPNDKRNSIYSRAAAFERKIQIILYSSGTLISEESFNDEFPEISFNNKTHDFGELKNYEKKVYSFRFQNTGKSELLISKVSSSCECLTVDYPQKSILPNAYGTINILFNSGEFDGKIEETITIFSNSIPNKVTLKILANIVGVEEEE